MKKYKIQYILISICMLSFIASLNVENPFIKGFLMNFGIAGVIFNILGIIYLQWYFNRKYK